MKLRNVVLGCLGLLVAAGSAQAGVYALKRSGGVTDGRGLSSSIQSAVTGGTITVYSGPGVAADTFLYVNTGWATGLCYCNSGAQPSGGNDRVILAKFNISLLQGLAGGKINKAELRFYATGGNSGPGGVGYVTSSDWSEGNKTGPGLWGYEGNWPGLAPAAPGASGAHPNGLNTDANQDANGVSKPGLPGSWANNQVFAVAKDGVTMVNGLEYNPWGIGLHPPYDQYMTIDVTSIVQVWANGTPNYGFFLDNVGYNRGPYLSEETEGPDLQPTLFVDYLPHGNPSAITNLAAGNPDWFKIDLTWTAPSANPPAACASYDIRYSTSPITDDATFNSAPKCPGTVPTPAAPGTTEHLTIRSLAPNTTYYFAIKSTDIVGTVSALSNAPVSVTTLVTDSVAPAQITTLAAPAVKPNYVTLTWTSVGDDGITGTASSYDLRYSTTAIVDDATFAAATPVVISAPKTPGSAETYTLRSLSPSTDYYFAIKAGDEVPNWSTLSNVVMVHTPDADPYPPTTITNLSVSTAQIHNVNLTWTAPADVGSAGMAGYDLRYSTSTITDANWSSATQVTGLPTPATAGSTETFTVVGLSPSTTYYFAIKSFDSAEPANVSALSNVANATTMPPIVPVTVHNPWLSNDRVADTHNLNTMAASYVKAFTPQGVVLPSSNQDKAINIYNNQKRRMYHWADEPPSVGGNDINDPTYNQNVFGWGLCGRHACNGCTIAKAVGFGQRKIAVPGDWQMEFIYDGGNHLFHSMTTFYVMTRGSSPHIAGCDEIQMDNNLVLNAVAEGRACPGYLLCGDTPAWEADAVNHYSDGGDAAVTTRWTGNMDLRLGQVFKRTWESWLNEHPTPQTDADSISGIKDPPFHHEANKDYKDYVNIPYWEPYTLNQTQNAALNIGHPVSYRRWANGTDTLAPDFRSASYQALLYSSTAIATYNDDSLTPDLHTATVGTQGEAVFKISVPYYLTDASFSGDFVKVHSGDVCNVQVAQDNNGVPGSWTTVWSASSLGTTHVANQSLRSSVFSAWTTWYIKVQIKGTVAKTDAGVSNFVVTTIFEHNKGAMAYLDNGVNNITLTFDNAAELQASRNLIHVTYKWKEYDGTDWTVDKQFDGYAVASPATFQIVTGGASRPYKRSGAGYDVVPPAGSYAAVPRTEYIQLEVVPPIPDPTAPAQIANLAVSGTPGSGRVALTWTATGDDANTGSAIAYDLRYSTSPITDDTSFNAATAVTGVPAPKVAGSTENYTVLYLSPSTSYYFAIKAIDKGLNRSPLSNVVTATTTAAAAVADLTAGTATSAKVSLTWTAIDDGSLGTFASYDLRYSTSPITSDALFNAATAATGLPTPKAPGSAESFAVTYLNASTTYYFAIKGIDAKGNRSPLSNQTTATTTAAPAVTNLTAGTPGATKVPLTWTAIDDGVTGTFTSYNLRYSTTAIVDDTTFNAATAVTGVPAPKAAGSAESFLVTGLTGNVTYYFAIKAVDAKGRSSLLSNVTSATTTIDTIPPQWIGNLKGTASHTPKAVDLSWTAPADYANGNAGPFTCASYQLRYSTSPILYSDSDASWNAATAVTGLTAPKAPGTAESVTVVVPNGGTTYYFAIKAVDDAGNVSQVSNCAAGKSSTLGDTVLQVGVNGYTGCMDTYIDQSSANWAGNPRMTLCGYGDGNYQRGMVRFDLSSLSGVNVTSATLYLYAWNQGQCRGSSGFYGVYPFTRSWVDSQTNWTYASSGSAWTTPGGDFDPTPDATAAKQPAASVPCWYNWNVTARVQSWLSGASTNYGWMVKCTDESLSNQDQMYQSEVGNSFAPKLVVSDAVARNVADINGDKYVNVGDLQLLVAAWGTDPTVRGFDPWADINGDGYVNVGDLQILVAHWGESTAP